MSKWTSLGLLILLSAAAAGAVEGDQRAGSVRRDVLIAAAASLSVLEPAITQRFHEAAGVDIRFTFAGSNTLARQIVEGASVDVFMSADAAQMDVVEQADRLVPGTRVDVLSNQLVIVVPPRGETANWPDYLASPAIRRLAMGDAAAVPAGVYGRKWLEAIGLWTEVEGKIVPLPSSQAALAAVREGRAQAGIVYATDAKGARGTDVSGVTVAHVVPEADAPPILYPAAAVRGGREREARRFLDFLRSAEARRVFETAGFRFIAR
jgi:molybdate transport system substrate-binding protein